MLLQVLPEARADEIPRDSGDGAAGVPGLILKKVRSELAKDF